MQMSFPPAVVNITYAAHEDHARVPSISTRHMQISTSSYSTSVMGNGYRGLGANEQSSSRFNSEVIHNLQGCPIVLHIRSVAFFRLSLFDLVMTWLSGLLEPRYLGE